MWRDSEAMKGAAGGRQECCIACIPQGPWSAIILLSKLNLHSEGQAGRPKCYELSDLLYLLRAWIIQKKAIA